MPSVFLERYSYYGYIFFARRNEPEDRDQQISLENARLCWQGADVCALLGITGSPFSVDTGICTEDNLCTLVSRHTQSFCPTCPGQELLQVSERMDIVPPNFFVSGKTQLRKFHRLNQFPRHAPQVFVFPSPLLPWVSLCSAKSCRHSAPMNKKNSVAKA